MEKLLSPKELGALLDLAPEVIRKLVRAGKLRAVRLGFRRIRISEAEAKAFVARNEQTAKVEKSDG